MEQQMPFKIIEVKARPRGTLRQVADSIDGVIQWRAVGDRLRLSVNNSMAVQEYLKDALKKAGAEITILREARITMEDVFIYLVESQEHPV
jgi:hypothetical protein